MAPNKIRPQFLIKIHFGQGPPSACLIPISSNAGVIIDKVDIQIAPDKDMNKSKSGTSSAIPSAIKKELLNLFSDFI